PALIGIIAAENRHVAAAAAGLVEKAPCRRTFLYWRDHLQEDGIDRQQCVLQAVFGDVAVSVANVQPHDLGDISDDRLEMRCHQTDLPQPQIAYHLDGSSYSVACEHGFALFDKGFGG